MQGLCLFISKYYSLPSGIQCEEIQPQHTDESLFQHPCLAQHTFQQCHSYWPGCSHATWVFAMEAAILDAASLYGGSHQLGYPSWKMPFTSNSKFKHLSDKMFINW